MALKLTKSVPRRVAGPIINSFEPFLEAMRSLRAKLLTLANQPESVGRMTIHRPLKRIQDLKSTLTDLVRMATGTMSGRIFQIVSDANEKFDEVIQNVVSPENTSDIQLARQNMQWIINLYKVAISKCATVIKDAEPEMKTKLTKKLELVVRHLMVASKELSEAGSYYEHR